MHIISALNKFLSEKEVFDIDMDGPERFAAHKAVLNRKPMIKNVFEEFHHEIMNLDRRYFGNTKGLRIELGAGVSPVKTTFPDVLATDILPADYLDRTLDAQNLDLETGSVRSLYCINCFHHFPKPHKFFSELERVVTPGGGAVIIEPFYGPFASIIYRYLFAQESFDKYASKWETPAENSMTNANQALSYIVFIRDKNVLHRLFPNLRVAYQKPLCNYLRYLLSGGLNFRMLVPNLFNNPLKLIESILAPIAKFLSLHHIIVIKRS
jgi:SAM-dependent methyltransferase